MNKLSSFGSGRRRALASAMLLAASPMALRAQADWPNRPIKLFVPVPPGGVIDGISRAFSESLRSQLGQPVVLEHKPGASATLAAATVAQLPQSDGYSLAFAVAAMYKLPHLQKLPYSPVDDLTYIIAFSEANYGLVVPKDSPWQSVADFVSYAKANPGKVSLGALGTGSAGHMAITDFCRTTGIDATFVPFKGGAETVTAFAGGHITAVLDASWSQIERQAGGRVLMLYARQRHRRLPSVPLARELGINYLPRSPFGIVAPKGLDPKIRKRLHDALRTAMSDPGLLRVMEQNDYEPFYMSGEDYHRLARELLVEEKKNLDALGLTKQ